MSFIDFISQDWPYIIVTLFFAVLLTLNSLAASRDSDTSTGVIILATFILLVLVPEFSAIFVIGIFATGMSAYLVNQKTRRRTSSLRKELLDHEIRSVERFLFQSADLITEAKHLKERERKDLLDGRRALDRLFHETPRV
jgi:hypothetical protein